MAVASIYTTNEYLTKNPTWDIEHSSWKAKNLMSIIKRNDLQLTSICEVGCGAGEILNSMHKQMDENIVFTGYEISPDAFDLCKQRIKDRLNYKLADLLEDESVFFNLIMAVDVVEHIEDYYGFLRKLKEKANFFIFSIPLEMCVVNILKVSHLLRTREQYGHIHYFEKETFLMTLRDIGYEIVDLFYAPTTLTFPSKRITTKILRFPRKFAYKYNCDTLIKTIGGFALMILAK